MTAPPLRPWLGRWPGRLSSWDRTLSSRRDVARDARADNRPPIPVSLDHGRTAYWRMTAWISDPRFSFPAVDEIHSCAAVERDRFTRTASSPDGEVNGVQEDFMMDGLRQKLDSACLHGPNAHRNVGVTADEDDGQIHVLLGQVGLKLEPGLSR